MSGRRRTQLEPRNDTGSIERGPGDSATRRRILKAAAKLIVTHEGRNISLATVARAAGVSRQALYLHFADRTSLFLALADHVDEERGLPQAIQRVREAGSAVESLRALVAMQAELNPALWPIARVVDGMRRSDAAAEQVWQDRLARRLEGCRKLVEMLAAEGRLRSDLDRDTAADLLWTLTSLRAWEDLVLLRRWSAKRYQEHMNAVVMTLLVREPARAGQ
jgi:AcrR family transcriptional regulator